MGTSARERIVICGAGVVGAAVAYYLTRRGARPLIVERARPGAAASGRAGGFLALDWNDGTPVGPLARLSFALHRELATALDGDTGYRGVETLMAAAGETIRSGRESRGGNPDWLDGNVVVHGLIGTPETTAQVEPQRFTDALVSAAIANGATLVTGTVQGLDLSAPGGAVRGVAVDGERIPADIVVLAMGPWTDRARSWVALPPIHALKGDSITLAADVPAQAVFSDYIGADGTRRSPEIYPRPDGVVYVNGYPEDDPLPDDPDAIGPSDAGWRELQRMAGAHSRVLATAPVIARRACYRPVTVDGIPLIGSVPDAAGVYVATGHGPWGILNAPATGLAVSEMIMDGAASSLDARAFSPDRLAARPL
jgi:glycine/D-amino acid oxidase-like deaminating enzyme